MEQFKVNVTWTIQAYINMYRKLLTEICDW